MTTAEDVVLPALLRHARGAYAYSIRHELARAELDDLPRNAAYVLGGMVNHGGQAATLVRELGVSKQAASQLIDTLVIRGYLERDPDPDDRRRVLITTTTRGEAAAAAIRAGVLRVDELLADAITPAQLKGLRAGLVALIDIKEQFEQRARARA